MIVKIKMVIVMAMFKMANMVMTMVVFIMMMMADIEWVNPYVPAVMLKSV